MKDESKKENGQIRKLTDQERQLYRERLIHFTILSQQIERYHSTLPQKKFEITCNEGLLSGSGKRQNDITVRITSVTMDGARKKFEMSKENLVYGRVIKSIREIE